MTYNIAITKNLYRDMMYAILVCIFHIFWLGWQEVLSIDDSIAVIIIASG